MNQLTIKKKVLAMTGISEEQYATAMWELGMEYIEQQFGNDEFSVSCVSQTRHFWQWYRNQWHIIDDTFTSFFKDVTITPQHTKLLREKWYLRHAPERIQAKIDSYVLDAAGILFDQLTHVTTPQEGVEL